MSKFRAAPRLQSEEAFVKAAEEPRKPSKTVKVAAPVKATKEASPSMAPTQSQEKDSPMLVDLPRRDASSSLPWEEYDPSARTTANQQPLRLNAYQYEQLKWLAESQDRSLAQILRRIIAPALEEAVSAQRE